MTNDPKHTAEIVSLVEGVGTLATAVYERLRGDIMTGALMPGEKLRVEYLRARYGAGVSPLREALNRLSAEGLVIQQDQKGFHVAGISRHDLSELITTRCWVEETALRKSIEADDPEWEENVVLSYHRLSRTPRSASRERFEVNPAWDRLHRAFHLALIGGCGSHLLLDFCEQLLDRADRYRQLAIQVDQPNRHEPEEHRMIMDAAIEGDADRAVAALTAHYEWTRSILNETIPAFVMAED